MILPRPFPSFPFFLSVLLCTAPAFAQQPPAGPPPVSVAKPVVKDIQEWDEFTGRFDAAEYVELRSRVGGYLNQVHFKDGALVKAGDLLFTIDPRPYKAALDQAKAAVEVNRSQLEFAKSDLERAEALRKTGNIADQLLDQRRQSFVGAQAGLNGNEAALSRAALELDFTEIRAPISGRISRKLVTEGNLVSANTTILTTIVTLDPIYFYFDVDERSYLTYSRGAKDGSRLSARSAGYDVFVALTDDKSFDRKGVMDFVDNRIDAATGTMRGRAVFSNADLFLTPGLFGRIRIPGAAPHKGILIPDEAIASDQNRRIVYIAAPDGSVTPKPVQPGAKIDGYRVIREGLTGDETVIVNGLMRVRPGVKVSPQMTTLPPVKAGG